jgi:hypothetical protein
MKKIGEAKKLSFKVETVRVLTAEELQGANGGAINQSSGNVVCSACPRCCPSNLGGLPGGGGELA